jgi:hypothetical protein
VRGLGKLYAHLLPLLTPLLLERRIGWTVMRLAQVLTQMGAAGQRKRLAQREQSVANQLSFND